MAGESVLLCIFPVIGIAWFMNIILGLFVSTAFGFAREDCTNIPEAIF